MKKKTYIYVYGNILHISSKNWGKKLFCNIISVFEDFLWIDIMFKPFFYEI